MTTPYFVISKEKKNLWFFISNNFFWIILLSLLYFGYHKLSFSFRKLDFYHIGSLKCIILCIFSLRIPEPLKMRCCFQLGSRPTFLTLVNQHPFALPPTTNKAVFEHFAVKLKLIQMKSTHVFWFDWLLYLEIDPSQMLRCSGLLREQDLKFPS